MVGKSSEDLTQLLLITTLYFSNIMTASMALISLASTMSIFVGNMLPKNIF